MPVIKLIVDGGGMKPGPAVAQQLGPMGINLGKVIEDVNKATSGFKGVKVPVELDVDPKSKKYSIKVFSPPVSELIKKELKIEKGSSHAGKTKVGNLAIEQVISIAKTKHSGMLAKGLREAVKLVVGSCVSLGILIENKPAKELMADIDSGAYDLEISSEKVTLDDKKKSDLDNYFKQVISKQEAAAKAEAEAKAAEEAAKLEAAATTATPGATTPATGQAPAPAAAAKPEAKKEDKTKKK